MDEGKHDPNDYKRSQPNSFANLVEKFLHRKKQTTSPNTWRKYRCTLDHAVVEWGDSNVKTIKKIHIYDLLISINKSSKYVHDIKCTLKGFFNWVVDDMELMDYPPKFPQWKYTMKQRKIVTKDTQHQIVAQIHKDTWTKNPRIFIAVELLRTYLHVRPMELMTCSEGDLDTDMGVLRIPTSKEGGEKFIKLVDADMDLLQGLDNGHPDKPLFRFDTTTGGQLPGQRFGHSVLLAAWRRACAKLGVEGVDLYGGTRHSSAVALGKNHEPGTVQQLTGHHTSKSFLRYFWLEDDSKQELYAEMKGEQ